MWCESGVGVEGGFGQREMGVREDCCGVNWRGLVSLGVSMDGNSGKEGRGGCACWWVYREDVEGAILEGGDEQFSRRSVGW